MYSFPTCKCIVTVWCTANPTLWKVIIKIDTVMPNLFIKRNYRFLPGVKAKITPSTYPNSPEIYRTLAKFEFSIYSYAKVYNIPACHKRNPTHSAIPDPLHWRTLLQQLDSSCYLWKHKSKFGCELWNLMGWFSLNSNRNVLG